MDHLHVDGGRIEARWWQPADPAALVPIVLLHEGLGSVSAWRGFPATLAARTRRPVFAYSRRGYGTSGPRGGGLSVSFMHDEAERHLPQVLEAAGIGRAVLFGHSDGGSIALLAAAAHPARVEALVLEAPHVFVETVTVESIARIRDVYRTTNLRARLARHHAHVDEAFRGWNDVWLAPDFLAWNIEACLDHIQCSVLVIQGAEDEYGSLAQVRSIAARIGARVETAVIQYCGHSPHRDQPKGVLERTVRFLDEAVGPRP